MSDPEYEWSARCPVCNITSWGSSPTRRCVACDSPRVVNTAPLLVGVMWLPVVVRPWIATFTHNLVIAGALTLAESVGRRLARYA